MRSLPKKCSISFCFYCSYPSPSYANPRFHDATQEAGIDFVHVNGANGQKFVIETVGPGGGFFDYDGDGRLDIYLINGAAVPGTEYDPAPQNALYQNRGDGTFADVTEYAGVGDTGYGMGCAVGDTDNDGDLDLYVTNFGANVLYRNEGDGTFADVTVAAQVGDEGWGGECCVCRHRPRRFRRFVRGQLPQLFLYQSPRLRRGRQRASALLWPRGL